jgi:hypothetical protein
LLAARGAIGESLNPVLRRACSYHNCARKERLNCMQFEGWIAQKESDRVG